MAGYIGYVGREYIQIVKKGDKPTDKEIIIDVPLALKLSSQGAVWPLKVIAVRGGSGEAVRINCFIFVGGGRDNVWSMWLERGMGGVPGRASLGIGLLCGLNRWVHGSARCQWVVGGGFECRRTLDSPHLTPAYLSRLRVQELRAGTLTEKAENITVSPR